MSEKNESVAVEELIPDDLHMSTGDRLRLVASVIEADPRAWDQTLFTSESYGEDSDYPPPAAVAGTVPKCGTTCCAAGWGVHLSPPDLFTDRISGSGEDWEVAGAIAFGLTAGLAAKVFYAMGTDELRMARVLRRIADLPEPRTWDDADAVGIIEELEW